MYRRASQPAGAHRVFLQHASGRLSCVYPNRTHVIGRQEGCDVRLDDDRVGPRHAEVDVEGSGLRVRPIGAAAVYLDGVVVAGDAFARDGASLLVGSKTLAVRAGAPVEAEYEAQERALRRRIHPPLLTTCTLEEVPLVDLLDLFWTSKKTCEIIISTPSGETGRLVVRQGVIVHASIDGRDDRAAMEALLTIAGWRSGEIDADRLDPRDPRVAQESLALSIPDFIREQFGSRR